MLVIGLAGGVASGKSWVARCFEHLGARILDADQIGHEVLKQPDVFAAIVSQWGEQVVSNEEINRSALGRVVFGSNQGDTSQLQILEQITHPRIGQLIGQELANLTRDSKTAESGIPAVILDAPVMFKAGWDQLCDKIVFIETEISVRQQRARARGWSPDEIRRRESFQTPINEKRKRSTDIIQNSNSKIETYKQACGLWQKWNLDLPSDPTPPSTLLST